ncbi:hypothetical protein [Aquimarina sp. 2201CG14-23]|uniref:hypothetical protein n=1 Tax=Aquimarina mycalae TaxID=3040073 RepID=UPI0024781BA7|nr:hypothetical protein [Aquimarina sp. 2201CG14-23]MDH7445859.1 hypothetical protein [Aquimarina sp. 2201CG14-23]
MMKTLKENAHMFFGVILFSCNTVEVSNFDIDIAEDAFIINSSSNFVGYYYKGSDAHFHYFVSRWDFLKDRFFKLKQEDLEVNQQFNFGTEELRVDFFEDESNIEFGYNEFYKLFIVE